MIGALRSWLHEVLGRWRASSAASGSAKPHAKKTITPAPKMAIPTICVDTQRFESLDEVGPWQFCVANASLACPDARARTGQLLESADGMRLPLPNCKQARCDCFYKLLPNQRTDNRRLSEERRTDVRYELEKPERRKQGRRKTDRWDRLRS
jgi:hypothetical protein